MLKLCNNHYISDIQPFLRSPVCSLHPCKRLQWKRLVIKSGSNKETSGLITKSPWPSTASGDEFCNCSLKCERSKVTAWYVTLLSGYYYHCIFSTLIRIKIGKFLSFSVCKLLWVEITWQCSFKLHLNNSLRMSPLINKICRFYNSEKTNNYFLLGICFFPTIKITKMFLEVFSDN